MLDEKTLNVAGWLAVVSAVITIPYVVLLIMMEFVGSPSVQLLYLDSLGQIGITALSIYVLVIFRRVLNQKADFHAVDNFITILIWITVALTVVGVINNGLSSETQENIGLLIILLLVPLGVVWAVFGFKLLNCDDDLFGHLKKLAYLTIAIGILLGTIVLAVVVPIVSAVADVVLALIFFRGANVISEHGRMETNFVNKESREVEKK